MTNAGSTLHDSMRDFRSCWKQLVLTDVAYKIVAFVMKPPVFLVAVGIGGIIIVTLVPVLLRMFTGWFYALSLVLFEQTSPSSALRVSRKRAHGHRRTLLLWIIGWAVASIMLSALTTTIVVGLGRFLVPRVTGSLALLAIAIGVTLILWSGVGLVVNLFSTITFAVIQFNLYRQIGNQGNGDLPRRNSVEESQKSAGIQLTPTRLFAAGVVGVFLAVAIGVVMIRSVRMEDNTQITAHRGASAAAPENTMAAVKRAIEDGTDWVEIDVQVLSLTD